MLIGLSVIFLPHDTPYYGIWNRYGKVVSSRGEVGVSLWTSKNLNPPHAPQVFQKGLSLVLFASVRRRRCLCSSVLSLAIDSLAILGPASTCLALDEATRLEDHFIAYDTYSEDLPRDEKMGLACLIPQSI